MSIITTEGGDRTHEHCFELVRWPLPMNISLGGSKTTEFQDLVRCSIASVIQPRKKFPSGIQASGRVWSDIVVTIEAVYTSEVTCLVRCSCSPMTT